MGYSPRYRIWTSEWPDHQSETDSQESIDRTKRWCKDRGDYCGYVRDTHTGDIERFGIWPESVSMFKVGDVVKWQGQSGECRGTVLEITRPENSGYVLKLDIGDGTEMYYPESRASSSTQGRK